MGLIIKVHRSSMNDLDITRNIVLISDAKGLSWLNTLLVNLSEVIDNKKLNIHIIHTLEFDHSSVHFQKYFNLHFYLFNPDNLKPFNKFFFDTGNHVTQVTYARLFIHKLLPKNISQVLYFDLDLLVLAPIDELFRLHINCAIGAVLDTDIGQWADFPTFNPGVMILNLDEIRKSLTDDILLKELSQNLHKQWGEMTVIQKLFQNDWHRIPVEYNFMPAGIQKELLQKPVIIKIIHFAGSEKPWTQNEPISLSAYIWNLYVELGRMLQNPSGYKNEIHLAKVAIKNLSDAASNSEIPRLYYGLVLTEKKHFQDELYLILSSKSYKFIVRYRKVRDKIMNFLRKY